VNRVLIVCCTEEAAKSKFKEMINLYGSKVIRAVFNRLTIEVDDKEYQFISQSFRPEKIIGREYHLVILDDDVQLTIEQEQLIMSRRRL